MALQIITGVIGNNMSYERIADLTTEDPADRVSVKAVLSTLNSTPDYFPEEKPVYGLVRIGTKFRSDLQGAE